jgi:hypothetical protein
MANLRDHARAVRYRQLALREADQSRAALLNLIADEAERGVLVISDRNYWRRPEQQAPFLPFQDWTRRPSPGGPV